MKNIDFSLKKLRQISAWFERFERQQVIPELSTTAQIIVTHYEQCEKLPPEGSRIEYAINRWLEVCPSHECDAIKAAWEAARIRLRAAAVVIAIGGGNEDAEINKASSNPIPTGQPAMASLQGARAMPSLEDAYNDAVQRNDINAAMNIMKLISERDAKIRHSQNALQNQMASQQYFGQGYQDQRALGGVFGNTN